MAENSLQDPADSTEQEQGTQNLLKPTQEVDPRAGEHAETDNGSAGSTRAQEITNGVLRFFSTASNETLGACLVGLASITYFVLGRVGLVIIGIVGGVVLHATWEDNVQNQTSDRNATLEAGRRKEASLNVVKRVLDWREQQQGSDSHGRHDVQDIDYRMSAQKELDFSGFQPATAAALRALTDAVIDNYVKYGSGRLILWRYANPWKVVVWAYSTQGGLVSFCLSTNTNGFLSVHLVTFIPQATCRHILRLSHQFYFHCHSLS